MTSYVDESASRNLKLGLVQIIGACQSMHEQQVIHRDLKLGNLFLDKVMNIKVGDFGLTVLIENPGERKKWDLRFLFISRCLSIFSGRSVALQTTLHLKDFLTVIASKSTLGRTASFYELIAALPTWGLLCFSYTLLVGEPPFLTTDVKTISSTSCVSRVLLDLIVSLDASRRMTTSSPRATS